MRLLSWLNSNHITAAQRIPAKMSEHGAAHQIPLIPQMAGKASSAGMRTSPWRREPRMMETVARPMDWKYVPVMIPTPMKPTPRQATLRP